MEFEGAVGERDREGFSESRIPAQTDVTPGPCGRISEEDAGFSQIPGMVEYQVLSLTTSEINTASGTRLPARVTDRQKTDTPPFLPFFSLLRHESGSPVPVGVSRSHRKVLIPLFSLVLPQHQGVKGGGSHGNGEQPVVR